MWQSIVVPSLWCVHALDVRDWSPNCVQGGVKKLVYTHSVSIFFDSWGSMNKGVWRWVAPARTLFCESKAKTHILRLCVRNTNKHRLFWWYDTCVLTVLPIYKSFVIQTVKDMKYQTPFRNPNTPRVYRAKTPTSGRLRAIFYVMGPFPVILKDTTSNQSKINTLLFYDRILRHFISRKPLPPVQVVLSYSDAPYSITHQPPAFY